MKFADIENIWSTDLKQLSNADRGRLYFERAKQVVDVSLSDPTKFDRATRGRRFRRSYLIEEVGCQPAVTTQNPRIKALLNEADTRIGKILDQAEAGQMRFPRPEPTR